MENENENLDSQNQEEENTDSENGENQEGEGTDLDALKQQNEKLSEQNRQLFARAKKAEGFTQDKDGNWIKPEKKEPKATPKNSQPNEPDYAKIAWFNSMNITHADDQKIVLEEAERLKLPLTDVLSMEHIKAKLETNKDQREAAAGMPKGKGNRGGTPQSDVDYWLAKGETPDDLELAEKVIDARMKKDPSNQMFDPINKDKLKA